MRKVMMLATLAALGAAPALAQTVSLSLTSPQNGQSVSAGATIREACEAAGIGRRTAYDLRHRDEAFALRWADALEEGTERLEGEQGPQLPLATPWARREGPLTEQTKPPTRALDDWTMPHDPVPLHSIALAPLNDAAAP